MSNASKPFVDKRKWSPWTFFLHTTRTSYLLPDYIKVMTESLLSMLLNSNEHELRKLPPYSRGTISLMLHKLLFKLDMLSIWCMCLSKCYILSYKSIYFIFLLHKFEIRTIERHISETDFLRITWHFLSSAIQSLGSIFSVDTYWTKKKWYVERKIKFVE